MEKTLAKNLRQTFTHYRLRFYKAIVLVLISNLLLVGNPLVFRHLILSLQNNPEAYFSDPFSGFFPWIALLLGVALLASLFKYLMRMEFMEISREVEVEVRAKLFVRIQNQSREFFDRHGIGELLSRLTSDITAYRDLLAFGIMYPLFFITLVIPGFIALFSISVPLASLSLIPIAIIPLLNWAFRGPIYNTSHAVQASIAQMSNRVQESYTGIRIVKGYVIEKLMLKRFKEMCCYFTQISFKLAWLQGIVFPLFTLVTRMTTLGLVIMSGYIILQELGSLSAADFLSFVWIQSYIFFPILMLGWVLPIYQRGRAAYARLVDIYEEPIQVKDNATSHLQVHPKADIAFHNLTFSYSEESHPVFSNLNLEIEGGSFVGITGPVGAGKSTLFHLLNRDYEIPHGTLFIGGHEIHKYSLKALHEAIVIVEQSSFLFSRSLADNVRFGRQEASQEELEAAAQFADLHETIMDFPMQYDTVVGERGVTLSGGQKQRVAMARAFLVDRSILLLDDIFSAIDTSTERRIFKAISRHFRGKTVLLITHRVSILEQMDRVLFMSKGKIVEDGTPAELSAKEGHYAALAALQGKR